MASAANPHAVMAAMMRKKLGGSSDGVDPVKLAAVIASPEEALSAKKKAAGDAGEKPLNHMTKNRARGPKRRLPTSAPVVEDKPEHAAPAAPAKPVLGQKPIVALSPDSRSRSLPVKPSSSLVAERMAMFSNNGAKPVSNTSSTESAAKPATPSKPRFGELRSGAKARPVSMVFGAASGPPTLPQKPQVLSRGTSFTEATKTTKTDAGLKPAKSFPQTPPKPVLLPKPRTVPEQDTQPAPLKSTASVRSLFEPKPPSEGSAGTPPKLPTKPPAFRVRAQSFGGTDSVPVVSKPKTPPKPVLAGWAARRFEKPDSFESNLQDSPKLTPKPASFQDGPTLTPKPTSFGLKLKANADKAKPTSFQDSPKLTPKPYASEAKAVLKARWPNVSPKPETKSEDVESRPKLTPKPAGKPLVNSPKPETKPIDDSPKLTPKPVLPAVSPKPGPDIKVRMRSFSGGQSGFASSPSSRKANTVTREPAIMSLLSRSSTVPREIHDAETAAASKISVRDAVSKWGAPKKEVAAVKGVMITITPEATSLVS